MLVAGYPRAVCLLYKIEGNRTLGGEAVALMKQILGELAPVAFYEENHREA